MKTLRLLTLVAVIFLVSVQSRAGLFSISDDEVIQAGRQAHDQVMQQYGAWEDPSQQARVDRIGSNLARFSQRPEIHYTFYLLNTDVINAIATPDGSLHVTRALLTAFPDNELTFVMGHEMTHVELRHAKKQAEQAATTQAAGDIISMFLGKNSNLAQLGISGGAYWLTMKYSRDDETQADEGGLRLMQQAGIDPHYGVAALQRLQSLSQNNPGLLDQFFSDHPLDSARIAHAQQIADQLTPQGSVVPQAQRQIGSSNSTTSIPAGYGYLKGHVSVGPLCRKPCPDPPGLDYTKKTLIFYDSSRNVVNQIHLNRNGYYKLAVPVGEYLYRELPDEMTAEFDAIDPSVQQSTAQSQRIRVAPNTTTYFNFTIWEKN